MLSEAVNRHIELYRSMGFKYRSRHTCSIVSRILPKGDRRSSSERTRFWSGQQVRLSPAAP